MEQNVFDVSFHKAKDKDYLKKLLWCLLIMKRAGNFVENFGIAQVNGGKKKNIAQVVLGKKKSELKEQD